MLLNRRTFIFNSFLFFFLKNNKSVKQTTIITSKNQIFKDTNSFRTLLNNHISNGKKDFNELLLLKKQNIILKESHDLINKTTMKVERIWINKNFYNRWKISKTNKMLLTNLVNSNHFSLINDSISFYN